MRRRLLFGLRVALGLALGTLCGVVFTLSVLDGVRF